MDGVQRTFGLRKMRKPRRINIDRHVKAEIEKLDPMYSGSGESCFSRWSSSAPHPHIALSGEVAKRPPQDQTIEHRIAFQTFELRKLQCEARIETNKVRLQKLQARIAAKRVIIRQDEALLSKSRCDTNERDTRHEERSKI
jgi:hypothetical protein